MLITMQLLFKGLQCRIIFHIVYSITLSSDAICFPVYVKSWWNPMRIIQSHTRPLVKRPYDAHSELEDGHLHISYCWSKYMSFHEKVSV